MTNDFQRRIIAEAVKHGGAVTSKNDQMAKTINEAPMMSAVPTMFGYSKSQFEAKIRQLLQKMGFEKGITRMVTKPNGNMVLYFANKVKARDFAMTFQGMTRRMSGGSNIVQFTTGADMTPDQKKLATGAEAMVELMLNKLKKESLDNESYIFMALENLYEEFVASGGMKNEVLEEKKKEFVEDGEDEVEEGFAQPTEKELMLSIKWLESIMKDPAKAKKSGMSMQDIKDNIAAAKDMLAFGKKHGSKIKNEEVEEAYAHPDEKVLGRFYEKTGKQAFEYRISQDSWGKSHGYPHEVCVSRKDYKGKGDWRAANVKGTVCYIVTDEGEGGKPVVEKWDITRHIKYVKAEGFEDEVEVLSESTPMQKQADFIKGLPAAAVKDIRALKLPSMKSGIPQNISQDKVNKLTNILKKHKVKLFNNSDYQSMVVIMQWFDTVHKEEVEVAEQFKAGDKVKVPHKGKMVSGKIVRFDNGGTGKAQQHGGGYVVDVGEPASILVPKHKVQKEEIEVTEAKDSFPKPFKKGEALWIPGMNKRGQLIGYTASKNVVGGLFTLVLPDNKQKQFTASQLFKANPTKMLKKEEVEVSESATKRAIENFMYSIPKAAIAELKSLMKQQKGGGVAQGVMRLASVTAILNKHGVEKRFMGFNTANLVNDYFDTFFGESVEENEEVEVVEDYKAVLKGVRMIKLNRPVAFANLEVGPVYSLMYDTSYMGEPMYRLSAPGKKPSGRISGKKIAKAINDNSMVVAEGAVDESSWGGGFETSREAQAKVQAGLRADAKREKILKRIGKGRKIGKSVKKEEAEVTEEKMNNYIAFYSGKKISVQAPTSFAAQQKAAAMLKVSPKKHHMITVKLADVSHSTAEETEVNEASLPTKAEFDQISKELAVKKLRRTTTHRALRNGGIKLINSVGRITLMRIAIKYLGKETTRFLITKVPVVGLVLGTIFAANRLAKGEYVKAAVELVGGVATTLPGFGLPVALACDAFLAVGDVYKIKQMNDDFNKVKTGSMSEEDFKKKWKLEQLKNESFNHPKHKEFESAIDELLTEIKTAEENGLVEYYEEEEDGSERLIEGDELITVKRSML